MIRVLQFEKTTKRLEETEIETMNFHDFKWLDCINPTIEEQEKIKDIVKLNSEDLERCLDENERPSLTKINNYNMIIFKAPFRTNGYFSTSSIAFLISENLLITIRKEEKIEGINYLWNSKEETKLRFFSKGPGFILYKIIDRITDDYFKILGDIEQEIEDLNEEVFENPSNESVKRIFDTRKTLVYFYKALSANRDVLTNLNSENIPCLTEVDTNNLRYSYNDIIQLIDMVSVFREILTGSLDIYLSSVSNNMNKVVKKMTALGSLVLVPTFITGLYGMNFKEMPELYWTYGYAFAWGLIVISIIVLYTYFKRKDWF